MAAAQQNPIFPPAAALNNAIPFDWQMSAHGLAVAALQFHDLDMQVRNGDAGSKPLRDAALRRLVDTSEVDVSNACERRVALLERMLPNANNQAAFNRRELDSLHKMAENVNRPAQVSLSIGAIDEFALGPGRHTIIHNHAQDAVMSVTGIAGAAGTMATVTVRVPTALISETLAFNGEERSYLCRAGTQINVTAIGAEAARRYYTNISANVAISSTVRSELVSAGVAYCRQNTVNPYARAPFPLWLMVQERLKSYWVGAGVNAPVERLMTAVQFEVDVLMVLGVMSLARLA